MTERPASQAPPDGSTSTDPGGAVLAIAGELLRETGREVPGLDLDSHLERDLGLDSLGRAELLNRVEHSQRVRLPERLLECETLRELAAALAQGTPFEPGQPRMVRQTPAPAHGGPLPTRAGTLVEVLDFHARRRPDETAILLYQDGTDQAQPISYAGLRREARRVAAGLRGRGLEPGQRVALMLPTGRDYFASFFGILLAGGVPVPIYPPLRPSQLEDHLRRHARLLANAEAALLITVPAARLPARLLVAQVPGLSGVVTVEELAVDADILPRNGPAATNLAFVQYSSGSTGDPKGVMLSHADLLANIRAMAERLEVRADDVFVSWLPLYHDMGLIGACLGSLYQGIPLAVMSPLAFLHRPVEWLWAIHRHRGTLSAAPNFAFELCLRQVSDQDIEGLDLSSLRLMANGAEPVSALTLRRFAERFVPYGLDPGALSPVYGLAECAVGLALPRPGRGLHIDRIQRDALLRRDEARPAAPDDSTALDMVACGHALAGHEIRIVDGADRELPERRIGRLQFRGPSATCGYLNNPEASAQLFHGDWLDSGDRGYLVGGEVYITGRDKDLIIRGGRNLYPYELEQAAGELDGVRKGCVAVFGATDPATGTERLVVVAETRETRPEAREHLVAGIRERTVELLDAPPDDIVLAPPQTVLKTSSGKIRRSAMRDLYERGELERERAPVWLQLVRLAGAGARPLLRRGLRCGGELAYGGYVWLIGGLLLPPAWLLAVVVPGRRLRWTMVRGLLRLAARLTGCRLDVQGLERLPDGPCVLVINHSSYLDALVLTATLPRPFRFVAKRELAAGALLRWPLQRLGTLFVERFDRKQSATEAEQLGRVVQSGGALAFFPEGTFTRASGLLPFRMGAFVTAARAAVPVVPIILRGTRAVLRAESWLPRRGRLQVSIAEPLRTSGDDWRAAAELARRSRAAILQQLGEPDLSTADSPFSAAD